MSISSLSAYFPILPRYDSDYILHMCNITGLYAIAGTMAAIPVGTAAIYGVSSMMIAQLIFSVSDKINWREDDLIKKIVTFVSSFFVSSVLTAFLINSFGFAFSFTAGIVLHGLVLATVFNVVCVAFPLLLCIGAAIGVKLLPNEVI
jgi:hypothetical protein